VALLATSPEHLDRLLVSMADAPAQLFTVLTLLFALKGMHRLGAGRRAVWFYLLAGLSFGWAYWVRHTQLVLALPVLMAILLGYRVAAARQNANPATGSTDHPAVRLERLGWAIPPLLAFCGGALFAAMPDIIYRWRVFGGPFATETTELPLMALRHIGLVAWQMAREALAAGEWGYLFPLAILGACWLSRRHRWEVFVLGAAFLAVLLVHLTYRALRLRDLISIFPLVDLAVACGAVALVAWARALLRSAEGPTRLDRAPLGRALLPAAVVTWVVLSLALSRWAMIDRLWRPGWASFGYMTVEQRAAFDRLASVTPPEAVVGASLNAGAIMMYTGRDAIRPYDSWTDGEWGAFLGAMEASDRPVFLLDDGDLMAAFIEEQQALEASAAKYHLAPIEAVGVPLFPPRDREAGWLYHLEWVP
jgi:hypothetical protein